MINHFPLQNAGTALRSAAPWVEGNGITAQVSGGGPSLTSDLINLIKTSSTVAGMFLEERCNRGFFSPGMGLSILMTVINTNIIHGQSAARSGKSTRLRCVNRGGPFPNVVRRGGGRKKACFLIAQLEVAFYRVQILFIQDGSPVAS